MIPFLIYFQSGVTFPVVTVDKILFIYLFIFYLFFFSFFLYWADFPVESFWFVPLCLSIKGFSVASNNNDYNNQLLIFYLPDSI